MRIALCTAVLLAATATLFAQDKPAYESDPKFIAAMKDGKDLREHDRYNFAADAFKKAVKLSGGQCRHCLDDLYLMQMKNGSYKDAVATVNQILALSTDPLGKSAAETKLGETLLAQGGDKPKPAQLQAAHTAFQSAIADYPGNVSALYSDGCALARMGNKADAADEFKACADAASAKDPMRMRAQKFAENPSLSLAKMAPAFEVKTLDGTRFNLDEMAGRVVLIDFWATWCGPCNEELPHVKKIAKEFANEPLTIISISWDDDAQKWKDFIAKNEMTWLQYRDANHKLSDRFDVHAIPHYFTIDSDGVLTAEMLGSGSDVEGKLKKLLKHAHDSKTAHETSTR